MNLKKYISELKRRNVIKAGLAYLIVAWLVAQVFSVVLPTFDAPTYFMKTLLFAFVIGFPIWLVFAWVYEITPEGIKKTKEIAQEKSILPQTGSKFNKLIITALSLAVVALLFNKFINKPTKLLNNLKSNVEFIRNDSINFIAILPFRNSKPNPETDYLGFALADQIIGDLRYFKSIVVRPSSSIRKYDQQNIDSKTIGHELKVGYVLNGNYLIEDDSIRLNIELIDISNNEMIWREPIKVDFQKTFELQDIVAKKVVHGMNIQFSKNEINNIGKNIPKDPLAYEYYLKSLTYIDTKKDNELAINMLNISVDLDSTYALTYSELGRRISILVFYNGENPENLKKVEDLYLKAISLDKESLRTYYYLSGLYTETGRTDEAIEIAKKMLKINPNDATAHFSLGYTYRYAGMQIESIKEMEMAAIIDPNANKSINLSLSYYNINAFDKALKVLEISKENIFSTGMKGFIYIKYGKNSLAKKYFNQIIEGKSNQFWRLISSFYLAYLSHNKQECIRILELREKENITDGEPMYYDSADYALIGDKEGCIRTLQKAIDKGYFNYPAMQLNSSFDSIRDDPEFIKVLQQAKKKHLVFKQKHFN